MQKKTLAMMLVTGCAISLLTGCGIPEEEHIAAITELKTENQEVVDKLNGKIADAESLLKAEQAKVRKSRIELDNASEEIKSAKQDQAKTSKELADEKARAAKAERELASAKRQLGDAQDEAQSASDKLAETAAKLADMTRRFDQFRANMAALSAPAPAAATAAPVQAAPVKAAQGMGDMGFSMEDEEPAASGTKSALDILNEMSTK